LTCPLRRRDPERIARADLQMSLYGRAAKQVFGVKKVRLVYQSLILTKTARVDVEEIRRGANDELEAFEAIVGAIELINIAVAHPQGKRIMGRRRSWRCRECSFRRRCAEDRT
jgi:hypothetical protein